VPGCCDAERALPHAWRAVHRGDGFRSQQGRHHQRRLGAVGGLSAGVHRRTGPGEGRRGHDRPWTPATSTGAAAPGCQRWPGLPRAGGGRPRSRCARPIVTWSVPTPSRRSFLSRRVACEAMPCSRVARCSTGLENMRVPAQLQLCRPRAGSGRRPAVRIQERGSVGVSAVYAAPTRLAGRSRASGEFGAPAASQALRQARAFRFWPNSDNTPG
jgi:hypothetical protein